MKTFLGARGIAVFLSVMGLGLAAARAGGCDPVPSGLVAWWQGEDNAQDAIGGNNGILENGTGFTTGEVGTAFNFNGQNNFVLVNPAAPSNLDVGQGSGMTFECWINPTTVSAEEILYSYERILGTTDGTDVGVTLAIHPAGAGGYLYANIVDVSNSSHVLSSANNLLTPNVWQHIALTYDKASGSATYYFNGAAVTTANLGTFTPQTSFTNFMFGGHTAFNSVTQPGALYSGAMDELSLYNRALSASEIAAIYQAGSAGKCATPAPPVIVTQPTNETVPVGQSVTFSVTATGSAPMGYQWSYNGNQIIGATGPSLTLANSQVSESGNYSVSITNAYGSTNSVAASLTVYGVAPYIIGQPSSQSITVGSTVTLGVAASGTAPLSFQWSLNGTNLAGATGDTLTLANAQVSQSGNYAVAITNLYGATNSAVAAVNVYGLPPMITSQPGSQTVFLGSSASFSVSVTGTAPLTYQWNFNGNSISGATNATLSLADVQLGQGGDYSVSVVNGFGSTNSVSALLTVSPLPACAPVPSGIVAWWQGQDNATDFIGGNNGVLENGTGFGTGEVGMGFQFNGQNNFVLVNPSSPTNLDVGRGTGLTLEEWIKPATGSKEQLLLEYERVLGSYNGADVGVAIAIHPGSPGGVLYVNLVDTNQNSHSLASPASLMPNVWQHIAMTYDKGSGVAAFYINGVAVATTPFGTFTPQTTFTNLCLGAHTFVGSVANPSACFAGSLDELSLYNRALSANEIAAIYEAGAAGKCLTPTPPEITGQPTNQTVLAGQAAGFAVTVSGALPLYYQWTFNGVSLLGATNASLTLTNVQPSEAGSYGVLVSNGGGTTNSVGATLTVVTPPVVTQQPASQTVSTFGSVTFGVEVSGSGPMTFQWQKNGTNLTDNGNLTGSTTTNLSIGSVALSDAGNYQLLIANPYASTNSAVATLTVPETVLWMGSTNAVSGTTFTVPVVMNALGVEDFVGGSVSYDPTLLTLVGSIGNPLIENETNNGTASYAVSMDADGGFAAGTNVLTTLVFTALPVAGNVTATITFGNSPLRSELYDSGYNSLPVIYEAATVQLQPGEYYGDVAPRFTGDHTLDLRDWVEEGRMVAGIDVPTNSDEFLRADCAPRNAPDGVLTLADWVQAGRYAFGLDPVTIITPASAMAAQAAVKVKPMGGPQASRVVQVGTVTGQRGKSVTVPVSVVCVTNENAVGLTVSFNTNQLRFLSVSSGLALASEGTITVNSNRMAGKLGILAALTPGIMFPAGTNQAVLLHFMASASASGSLPVTVDDSVVKLAVADVQANSLGASTGNGGVVLPAQPTLAAAPQAGNLNFTWALDTGTFQVQTASQLSGPWTTLVLPLVTNGNNVSCVFLQTNQQQYFRLQGQ